MNLADDTQKVFFRHLRKQSIRKPYLSNPLDRFFSLFSSGSLEKESKLGIRDKEEPLSQFIPIKPISST